MTLSLKKNEDIYVEEHLKKSTLHLNGINLTRDTYAEAVYNLYQKLLLEKENYYNDIIKQLNKRSNQLKNQLKEALIQLQSLKGSTLSEENLFESFHISSSDISKLSTKF